MKHNFGLPGNPMCRRLCQFGLVVCLVCLAACASRWQKPEVTLVDVRLQGGTLFEQRYLLKLRVHNPNEREVNLDGLSFDLFVGEGKFASGHSNAPVVIPQMGDALVEVEAQAQTASLLKRVPELLNKQGKLPYRIVGTALLHGRGLPSGPQPFERAGELDLPSLGIPGMKRIPTPPTDPATRI